MATPDTPMAAQLANVGADQGLLRALWEQAPAPICVLEGPDQVLAHANPQALQLIGQRDLIGKPLREALPELEGQGCFERLDEIYRIGEAFEAKEVPASLDRHGIGSLEPGYFNLVCQPLRDPSGRVRGLVVHATDVTEGVADRRRAKALEGELADEVSGRMRQQQEQRRLREEQERLQRERLEALEQSDKLKDQFLAILSHELRTPINAIMGFGSVLDDEVLGSLTETQHAYTRKILSSADALLAMIEDLLIVSRVQAGKFSINPRRSSFDDLVSSVLETQGPAAEKNAVNLCHHLQDDLPTLVADPLRIEQVINNLVGNAIKFTPDGGQVVVRARVEGDMLRCEVSDTGIGIAEADIPQLFQRFARLDMSNTRAVGGVGLGLSIVKAIVDAHGGQVGIHSEPGRGATFWFTLPLPMRISPA